MEMFLVILCIMLTSCGGRDLTSEPGYLKPFGQGRPSSPIEEVAGFPNPRDFFVNYVKPMRPLKMKNAAKLFQAYHKWTDDYLGSDIVPEGYTVSLESAKKEGCNQDRLDMSFREFVQTYNNTDYYLVDDVPSFLKPDVILPCPLQCRGVIQNDLTDNGMWFSSGGTKGIVHSDNGDNINCLFRGNKTFVMVDPWKHRSKIDKDGPGGACTLIDVDRVDYTKYPKMTDVDFYHVNITAGDCVFIPHGWIHQVRSYGSNLAANVFWHHHVIDDVDLTQCNEECDLGLTLNYCIFNEIENDFDPILIRDHINAASGNDGQLTLPKFVQYIVATDSDYPNIEEIHAQIRKIFKLMDSDDNGLVLKDDISEAPLKLFVKMSPLYTRLEELLHENVDDIEEEHEEKEFDEEVDIMEHGEGEEDEKDERDEKRQEL